MLRRDHRKAKARVHDDFGLAAAPALTLFGPFTAQFAAGTSLPRLRNRKGLRLLALLTLRGNPEETEGFFLAAEGMIPPESFFNPTNLGRIPAATATRTLVKKKCLPARPSRVVKMTRRRRRYDV